MNPTVTIPFYKSLWGTVLRKSLGYLHHVCILRHETFFWLLLEASEVKAAKSNLLFLEKYSQRWGVSSGLSGTCSQGRWVGCAEVVVICETV